MPRPKGSKNKVKTAIPTTDFAALIAEKAAAKESLTADIAAEYYGAAEPPVRCDESHLSGLTEPPHFVY